MDERINKQADALLAQAKYLRDVAGCEPHDEYDIERLAEAEAFEAGADALDRVAALERELAEAREAEKRAKRLAEQFESRYDEAERQRIGLKQRLGATEDHIRQIKAQLAEARKPCPCKVRDAAIASAMGGE